MNQYQTATDIVKELKPSPRACAEWLQQRGVYVHDEDGALEEIVRHTFGPNDKATLVGLIAKYPQRKIEVKRIGGSEEYPVNEVTIPAELMAEHPPHIRMMVYSCAGCRKDHNIDFTRLDEPDEDGNTHMGACAEANVPVFTRAMPAPSDADALDFMELTQGIADRAVNKQLDYERGMSAPKAFRVTTWGHSPKGILEQVGTVQESIPGVVPPDNTDWIVCPPKVEAIGEGRFELTEYRKLSPVGGWNRGRKQDDPNMIYETSECKLRGRDFVMDGDSPSFTLYTTDVLGSDVELTVELVYCADVCPECGSSNATLLRNIGQGAGLEIRVCRDQECQHVWESEIERTGAEMPEGLLSKTLSFLTEAIPALRATEVNQSLTAEGASLQGELKRYRESKKPQGE